MLLLPGCASGSLVTPAPITLRIAGSTSMSLLLRDLADAYQSQHPSVFVDIQGGGSTIGLRALRAEEADLAAVSWHTEDDEKSAGLRAVPIARDAVAVVVNPGNPVSGLTLRQVRSIYQGLVLDWKGLGGIADEPVVVSREDGSGTRSAFETMVMGDEKVTLNSLVLPGSQAATDYVAEHPGAVAYLSMAELGSGVRAVPLENVLPTVADVQSGAYHLTRLLYLFVPQTTPAAAQSFVDFVLSPAGQAVVARHVVALR